MEFYKIFFLVVFLIIIFNFILFHCGYLLNKNNYLWLRRVIIFQTLIFIPMNFFLTGSYYFFPEMKEIILFVFGLEMIFSSIIFIKCFYKIEEQKNNEGIVGKINEDLFFVKKVEEEIKKILRRNKKNKIFLSIFFFLSPIWIIWYLIYIVIVGGMSKIFSR